MPINCRRRRRTRPPWSGSTRRQNEFGTPAKRSADEIRIPIGKDDAKARQTVQAVIAAAKKGQSLQQIAASTQGAQFNQIKAQAKSALPDAVASALFGLKQGAV